MEVDESNHIEDELWDLIANFRGDTASLEQGLDRIREHCLNLGLPSVNIKTLVDIINTQPQDDYRLVQPLLCCLIPNESLSDSVVDGLFAFLFVHYHRTEELKDVTKHLILLFLVWTKLGVVKKEYLERNYYHSLFLLFLRHIENDGMCYLLSDLTKVYHAKLDTLNKLKTTFDNNTGAKKKLIGVLLERYMSLSTEVPANFLSRSKFLSPPKLKVTDNGMSRSLDAIVTLHFASDMINLGVSQPSDTITFQDILDEIERENDCGRNSRRDIGAVCSIGSIAHSLPSPDDIKARIKLSSIDSMNDLLKHWNDLEIPSNPISVLGSKGGRLYASLANLQWQQALNEQVGAVLNTLVQNRPRPDVNFAEFLKALANLQATAGQGLPSVSTFLTCYFVLWDGHRFRREVIDLIPWFFPTSLKDMQEFMENLFNIYTMNDLEFKIKVIQALGDLHTNLVLREAAKHRTNESPPFIDKYPSWMLENPNRAFKILVAVAQQFINVGILKHSPSPNAFLLQALSFHFQVLIAETQSPMNMSTVVSGSLVIMCQSSGCVSLINQLCCLLNRYWKELKDLIPRLEGHSKVICLENFNTVEKYLKDTACILFFGIEKLGETILGQVLDDEVYQDILNNCCSVQNLLSVKHHIAFSPVISEIADELKIDRNSLNQEQFKAILHSFAPHCAELLESTIAQSPESESYFPLE